MDDHDDDKAHAWRRRLGIDSNQAGALEANLESTGAPSDRIRCAREEMRRIVKDRFGGDAALLAAVDAVVATGRDAVQVLETADRAPAPSEFSALEAIVAFDGTRPSFLVRDGEIDLTSSFSTSRWKTTLAPRLSQLAAFAACVGRVELGDAGIGTAFLIAPTLALTNRHVAQAIAQFGPSGIEVRPDIALDFGREHQARDSYDRRAVRKVLFAGTRLVAPPVDHGKLDLALMEVTPSTLSGASRDRKLDLQPGLTTLEEGWMIAAAGYPADWRQWVPPEVVAEHEELIVKLLEGDKGSKRFAPGQSGGMLAPSQDGGPRTALHDATTINGNSGSPMAIIDGAAPLRAVGLHYGGQWQGERVNWAHVLAACADVPVTGGMDLRAALQLRDVAL